MKTIYNSAAESGSAGARIAPKLPDTSTNHFKLGLGLAIAGLLVGCAAYVGPDDGYYDGGVYVDEPGMVFYDGGFYHHPHDVHDWSHRGAESRGFAHGHGGGGFHSGGGFHGGGHGGGGHR